MIFYFDKSGDIHTTDDQSVVDINYDALVRGVLRWVKTEGERRKRKRLRAPKGGR